VSDEEDNDVGCSSGDPNESISILAEGMTPTPGGPFSALTPSMWPQDLLSQLGQPEDPNSQPDYRLNLAAIFIASYLICLNLILRYDEFGFRVEEEDGPEQSSNKLLGIPFVEDPQHR